MSIEPIGQIKSNPIQAFGKTHITKQKCFGDEFPVFVHYNVEPGDKIDIVVVYLVFGEDLCEVQPTEEWLHMKKVEILESLA